MLEMRLISKVKQAGLQKLFGHIFLIMADYITDQLVVIGR